MYFVVNFLLLYIPSQVLLGRQWERAIFCVFYEVMEWSRGNVLLVPKGYSLFQVYPITHFLKVIGTLANLNQFHSPLQQQPPEQWCSLQNLENMI